MKTFIIAQTEMVEEGLQEMLNELGVPDWETAASSSCEKLTEVAGKLCYLSFSTELNKNLTRVGTRNNHDYIQDQLIGVKHGSVLEHSSVSVATLNCSRVLTHELVRHRAGTAFSQVSGRFVRSDKIGYYEPRVFSAIEELTDQVDFGTAQLLKDMMREEFERQESVQRRFSNILKLDSLKDFGLKKMLTSAIRRMIGNGQTNHILITANHRSWRHILEARSAPGAEEEARLWAYQVWQQLVKRYPAIYADSYTELGMFDIPQIVFKHSKV